LAGSQRALQEATVRGGASLQSGGQNAGERTEVGDDRGGVYKTPSAGAPFQSRQQTEKEERIEHGRKNLKNISSQKSGKFLVYFKCV
jgi:hypothetical protein